MESLLQNTLVVLSVMIPTLCAWLLIGAIQACTHSRLNTVAQLGLAYLLGAWLAAALLNLVDGVTGELALPPVYALLTAIALLTGYVRKTALSTSTPMDVTPPNTSGDTKRIVLIALLAFILLRLAAIFLEVHNRPIYPWDAWATWSYKARVWFEFRHMLPFVAANDWLQSGSMDSFTVPAWQYPNLVSLLQVWPALHLDAWNEPLLNMPWFFCLLAILALCYGFLRQFGHAHAHALLATALLVSIPLLHVHAALAGYADIWLAGAYLMGVICLYGYLHSRGRVYLLLLAMTLIALVATKREGIILVVTLLLPLAWIYLRVTRRRRRVFAAAILLAASSPVLLQLLGFGEYFKWMHGKPYISLPWLGEHALGIHVSWSALYDNLFGTDSWHLFWFVIPAYLALTWKHIANNPPVKVTLMAPLMALLAILMVYTFTEQYAWLDKGTSINRTLLPAALGLLFCAAAIRPPWGRQTD